MLTFACGILLAAVICVIVVFCAGLSWAWGITFGILGLLCVNVTAALILKKASAKINAAIQQIMMETRHKLEVMQNQYMRRPMGSQKQMMAAFEVQQNKGLRLALEACDQYNKLYKWSPMLKKQTDAMRAMFCFQLKDYDKVDELLEKCFLFDPQILAVKMVRMYKKNARPEEIDKFYKKKCAKIRGDNCILPVALYSWILVKQGRKDDAFKVLTDSKQKTDNETLHDNWEHLANDRVNRFSNAGLGELWYAMGLEEMKVQKMRQQQYQYRR